MVGRVLNLEDVIGGDVDQMARQISQMYVTWDNYRQPWLTEKQELRNYLFATDTRKTTNKQLPWKNSTTIPKLTQIRDNLHANYMSALFPHSKWLQWEGDSDDDQMEAKRSAIESYMETKLRQDKAEIVLSKLLLDYIDTGNVFGTAIWVDESTVHPVTGEVVRGYVGPRIVRVSPYDTVFNPTAPSFEESPKMVRAIQTLGDLAKLANKMPPESDDAKMFKAAIDKTVNIRKQVRTMARGDQLKNEAFQIDGFGSIQTYYQSDFVEILTFYGDLYDQSSGELLENYIVSIIDRSFVAIKKPNPNWTTHGGFFHAGWRQRPDNLYAMGPLDNLVGMQYRIDHLENLKADVFDMIAFPVQKIKGFVQDYVYEPGARIYLNEEGDVEFMHPDTTALNADMQIDVLERRMEELAGAPKEAMGIRSPGEKTKFEVQVLDNAASRIFLNKIKHFEKVFLEPLLNYMLVLARQNMSGGDVSRTLDSEIDAVIFSTVTKDDLTASGVLRPVGASHFAYKANMLQNLVTLMNSAVAQDAQVKVHLSGKKIAKIMEEMSDLDQFKIYGDNVRVFEQMETQRLFQAGAEQTQAQANTPPGILPHDQAGPQAPAPAPAGGLSQISPDFKLLPDRLRQGAPVVPQGGTPS
jgi:hypothetical protein